MTTIRRITTSQIEGNSANTDNTSEIRPFGEASFFVDTSGPTDKLVLSMFEGTRTHLKSKVVGPGVLYGSNADSGDGGGLDTIKLIPDSALHFNDGNLGNDQYIVVDPTGGEPGHIHLRAGGTQDNSSADLYLGGELTCVRVSDTSGIVTVRTTNVGDPNITLDWSFQTDGNLYFPGIGNNRIGESEPGLVVSSDNSVVLQSNNNIVNTYEVEFIGYIHNGFNDGPGATLTVTEIVAGTITDGMTIYGAGLPPEGWVVTIGGVPDAGSGGIGNYLLSGANFFTSSQSFNNNVPAAGSQVWTFGIDGSLTTPGGYIKPDATDGFLTIEGPLFADMVQEEGGGVRTITNGVKIRTHRAFDDLNRDWNFSWDGAIYTPRDPSNPQVGAIEWRTDNVTSQVRRTEGGTLPSGRVVPPGLMLFSNNIGAVSVLTGNSKYWTFEETGNLTLPNDSVIRADGTNVEVGNLTNFNVEANSVVNIFTDAQGAAHQWQFGDAGEIIFPDSTVQTTGYQKVAVPTTSLGQLGDQVGMIAHDANYHYYCKENYAAPIIYTYIGVEALPPGTTDPFVWTNQLFGANTYWIPYFGEFNTSNPVPQAGWNVVINGQNLTIDSVTDNLSGFGQTYVINFSAPITNGNDMSYTASSGSGDIWVRIAWSADTW